MSPLLTPKKRRGLPQARKSARPEASSQRGCEMTPTLNPRAANRRPTRGTPKVGRSTYASPLTSTTSSCSQPRARASSRLAGRNASGPGRTGACFFRPICTSAAMGWSYNPGEQVGKFSLAPGLRRDLRTFWYSLRNFAERSAMSDAIEPRPPAPSPAEGAERPPPAGRGGDLLAGDWSDGLHGAVHKLGIPEPKLLALQGLSPPAPASARAVPAPSPAIKELEAPDASGSSPSPAFLPDDTPPSPAPAFDAETATPPPAPAPFAPDVTPPFPTPAFGSDLTPPSGTPAFLPEHVAPQEVMELQAEDASPAAEDKRESEASPWDAPTPAAAPSAPTPWSEAVAPSPGEAPAATAP